MEDTSQDPEPTNNKDDIVETPECRVLSLILHDYQESIFSLSDKYFDSKFIISELQTKIDSSEPRKANRYLTSQNIARDTMEAIRGKAIILRNGHAGFWEDFLNEICTDKSKELSSPDKIGKLEFFIGYPVESSDSDKTQETAV
ncbi:hypothetical protein BASA60_009344 [Batrachochytrium salamandrivorans]|nr:hypothetical protein BASA60_009344 [Batrachochytrium salamandrivorans]KAH9252467.1 hypothetical protein BASA81_009591 [Batrachochytrium salamandrivorans]